MIMFMDTTDITMGTDTATDMAILTESKRIKTLFLIRRKRVETSTLTVLCYTFLATSLIQSELLLPQ